MRVIKYRVWDKDLNKMHICGENVHDSMQFLDNQACYYNLQNGCGSLPEEIGEGTYELMQFTGLKDKNGQEIYEGDIVKYSRVQYTDCSRTKIEAMAPPIVGEVYYSNSLWLGIKNKNDTGRVFMPGTIDSEEFEIISNIYENPEMLEGEK